MTSFSRSNIYKTVVEFVWYRFEIMLSEIPIEMLLSNTKFREEGAGIMIL